MTSISNDRVYVIIDKRGQYIETDNHKEFHDFRVYLSFEKGIWFYPLKEQNKPAISVLKCDSISKKQYKKLLNEFKKSKGVKSDGR